MKNRKSIWRASRFFLFLWLAGSVYAQRDLGTIVGTITDQTGLVVAGATVTITEDATGLSYSVTTGTSGTYTRPALKPGTYTLVVEAVGFKKTVQRDVLVTAGDRVGVNLPLQVGEVAESVEVKSQAPLLQTESAAMGTDVNSRTMIELPLGGQRKFTYLARLSPGVLPGETGARDANGGSFSANGVRSNGQNNFLLNGVDNNVNVIDFLNQTAYVVGPSLEAIGEMRVLTNGYNAEYGRGAGGVVNVTIKSGTNQIHGAAFEFLQNTNLDANKWERNRSGLDRSPLHQNQFGGAAGGPVIKNRTFWFADYQGIRVRSTGGTVPSLGNAYQYTIPTAAMKHGDFSGLLGSFLGTDALGNQASQGEIYDFLSTRPDGTGTGRVRDPFPGNQIPLSRMDPIALKVVQLYPDPNQNLTGRVPANNYYAVTSGAQQSDQGDLRLDHRLTDKDGLFGSLSWTNDYRSNSAALPGILDETAHSQYNLSRNAMISYTRIWTPSIISESRIGYSRLVTGAMAGNADVDVVKQLGIGGFDPFTLAPHNGGLLNTVFDTPVNGNGSDYTQVGGPNASPALEYSNVWDFIQNVAVNHSGHAMKFGAEFRPIQFPFSQFQYNHGIMFFNRDRTNNPQPAFQGQTGDAVASLLLGYPSDAGVSSMNFISSERKVYAFYGQDDWKFSPKLTVNLGLRYELFSPAGEKFGRQSTLDFETRTLAIAAGKDQNTALPPNFSTTFPSLNVTRGQVSKYLIPWDKLDFAPRIGLAYQFDSRTVVRAGYGIFYGGEENQGGYPNPGYNVPFNETVTLIGPTYDPNPFLNRYSDGLPSNVFSLPASIVFRGVGTDFRTPLVHKWNFAAQRELPLDTALEVGYIGNHQAHQVTFWDPNTAPSRPDVLVSSSTQDSLRPVPSLSGTAYIQTFGYGNYDALTVKLEKRNSHGLEYLVSYTWGHVLSNVVTPLYNSIDGLGTPDPRNLKYQYSDAVWDLRHNFVASAIYELPVGKGKLIGNNWNPIARGVLGNWQANALLSLRTGSHFGINTTSGVGYIGKVRPVLAPSCSNDQAPAGGRTAAEWFDIGCYSAPAPYTNGNLGNQTNSGPGQHNLDLSLFKDIALGERYRLTLRAEAFNLTNTPQFDVTSIGYTQGLSNFGKISGTLPATERHLQLALRFSF